MNVVAINGSPKQNGNTAAALAIMQARFEQQGIEFETIHVGNQPLQGCTGCGGCAKMRNETCVHNQDLVNESIQKLKAADGIVLASPVYFSNMPGTMKCFLDRVFYVSTMNRNLFAHKVGASLCVLRRSGGVETFNALNHYLNYSQMLLPASNYWNVIHGARPDEIYQDLEGVQIIETLVDQMVYVLQMQATTTVEKPALPKKVGTNFIR
ncbi:MAG: flavodoxin family protein [Erysipelotrichaceae bacterium]